MKMDEKQAVTFAIFFYISESPKGHLNLLCIVITINITLKVNLYFNEHFNGEEEYSYVDKPQLNFDNRALSLIGERLVDACVHTIG